MNTSAKDGDALLNRLSNRSTWRALRVVGLALSLTASMSALAGSASQTVPVMLQSDPAPADETPEQRQERLKKLADERRAAAEAERDAKRLEVVKMYEDMCKSYMNNKAEEVAEQYKTLRTQMRVLSREQQDAIRHMAERAPGYRPAWWNGTKKQEKNSFEAELWGRKFWANYVPTDELGLQAVFPKEEFNRKTNEFEIVDLIVLVTWKPLMVDSPDAAKGRLARENNYALGDIAELIIWHELGHNYITENLPTNTVVELYTDYDKLYSTMQEFYADLSALYHCSPRARRMVLQFRLDEFDYYTQDESHCRAAHGLASVVVADMLENPDAWPSVHFPPKVPDKQVELNTIIYIYENLAPTWTVEEDIRLQKLAEDLAHKQGEKIFKSKGTIELPGKNKYNLMVSEDRENQIQRDTWVSGKLDELIKAGRVDKLAAGEEYNPPERSHTRRDGRITIHFGDEKEDDKNAPKRIEVPWNH